jgi:hypothetical protein
VAGAKTKPLVSRRYLPDEEAQLRALRVLASSMNKGQRAAEQSDRKTLDGKESDGSSAKASLP